MPTKKPKVHIHFSGRGELKEGRHTTTVDEWSWTTHERKSITLFGEMIEQLRKVYLSTAVAQVESSYTFHINEGTEYLEVKIIPLKKLNVTVFFIAETCFCDKEWENKGAPPF